MSSWIACTVNWTCEVKSCPPSKLLEQNRLSYIEAEEDINGEVPIQEDLLAFLADLDALCCFCREVSSSLETHPV